MDDEQAAGTPDQQGAAPPTPLETLVAEYDVGDASEASSSNAGQAPAETSTTQESPVPQRHPSYLVRMARDLGLSDEEINSTPTDHLGQVVQLAQANIQKFVNQRMAEDEANKRSFLQQQQPTPKPVEAEEEISLAGLDESLHSPEIVGAFRQLAAANKTAAKRIKELEGRLSQGEQREQARHQMTRNQEIDAVFASLGPQIEKHIGKGTGQQVKTGNPVAFQNRLRLVARVAALEKTEQSLGNSDFSFADELKNQARSMFNVPVEESEDEPAPALSAEEQLLQQRRAEWNGGTVARPTQRRQGQEPAGPAKARKSVAKALANAGFPNGTIANPDPEASGFATHEDFLE